MLRRVIAVAPTTVLTVQDIFMNRTGFFNEVFLRLEASVKIVSTIGNLPNILFIERLRRETRVNSTSAYTYILNKLRIFKKEYTDVYEYHGMRHVMICIQGATKCCNGNYSRSLILAGSD